MKIKDNIMIMIMIKYNQMKMIKIIIKKDKYKW